MTHSACNQPDSPKTYALLSHESAVEAIWALAARNWQGILDDESICAVPDSQMCVKTQGDFKELSRSVDLPSLGIRKTPADLLVPDKSCCSRGKLARFHVWTDSFPAHSFVRVHDRVFVSTPFFVLFQLVTARRSNHMQQAEAEASAAEIASIRTSLDLEGCMPSASEPALWDNVARFARATQVLMDFMGTYRFVPADCPDEAPGIVYQEKPLVSPESLEEYLSQMQSAKGIERARRAAAAAIAGSASPMETALFLMLTLPKDMGGFGLPRPRVNEEVPIESDFRLLVSQDTIVPDLSWPDSKLAVEYLGWDDHFGAGPQKVAKDAEHVNSLVSLGWTVLHVTFEQMRTVSSLTLLAHQITHALGVQLPTPTDLELIRRTRLLMLLLPNTEACDR